MAQFSDDKGRIYSYVDPYDEIAVQFSEFRQEGDYRIFDAKVNVPLEMSGRKVRLVLHWDTHSLYAIGSCALSLDYRLRSDEPIEVFVNGRRVEGYAFDLTEYVNSGEINRIRIKAVAPEVKREDILDLGDDKVVDLDSYFSCHGFDKIKSAKLRVGKKLTEKNYRQLADCSMMNSGFDSGDSRGWQTEGSIKIVRDIGRRVKIIDKGGLKQAIEIKPGNYSLKVDLRTQGRSVVIGVIGEREFSSEVKSNGEWETHTVVFHVPEEEDEVTVYARTGEGEGDVEIDGFRVVANKVWKQ
jgi:predicted RNA-binding protein with TRAM domain